MTPRFDDMAHALSRRRFLAGLGSAAAAAAFLAACNDDGDETSAAGTSTPTAAPTAAPTGTVAAPATPEATPEVPQTRTFTHALGTTEVPVAPRRIVTTQDQNGLLPLLELGVVPVASAALQRADGTHFFRRVESYDVSGIANAGDYWEPDLEAIASHRPDLIVAHEGNAEIYDQLSAIAPTVAIQIFDRPLTEVLRDFADLVGALDRWETLNREYQETIAAFKSALPRSPEEIVLSRVEFGEGVFWVEPPRAGQAVATVLLGVGFARPEPQSNLDDWGEFSIEQIREHEGDLMIAADFSAEQDDPSIAAARAAPVFQSLDVVQRGEFHVFDGSRSVGSAFEKMHNFIDFLRSVLIERDPAFAAHTRPNRLLVPRSL